MVNLLDDTPIVPGDSRTTFEQSAQARQVLNDAEEDLRDWSPNLDEVQMQSKGMGNNLMPQDVSPQDAEKVAQQKLSEEHETVASPSSITSGGQAAEAEKTAEAA